MSEIPVVERRNVDNKWCGWISRPTLQELQAAAPQAIEDLEIDTVERDYLILKPNHDGAEWSLVYRVK